MASVADSAAIGAWLVIPGVDELVEGQMLRAHALAERANPVARAERLASRTDYEHLDGAAATRLAERAYPTIIDRLHDAVPLLPPGQRIIRFLNDRAAQIDLGQGKRAVLESSTPIAAPSYEGGHRRLNLALSARGEWFRPLTSPAVVSIPKRLQSGVRLVASGLVLTPVDGAGRTLHGSGTLDEAAVVYPNTQTDVDTVIKPTSTGFETYSLLRSIESPRELAFRITLPLGARLKRGRLSNTVEILSGGRQVASVLAPTAYDATDTPVPVSVTVSGEVLTLSVDHSSGDYRYPISVDPQVEDTKLHLEWAGGNWGFETDFSSVYKWSEATGTLVDSASGSVPIESWGLFRYATQGASHIFKLSAESSSTGAAKVKSDFKFMHNVGGVAQVEFYPGTEEKVQASRIESYGRTTTELCPTHACATTGGSAENAVVFQQTATTSESFTSTLYAANVEIYQEGGPTSTFNTESATINEQQNVLHGTTAWLGPNSGIFEVKNSDPGVGVSEWTRHSPQETGWDKTEKPACEGVQCAEKPGFTFDYYKMAETEHFSGWTNDHNLPDGEDTVEFKVKNSMGSASTPAIAKVKVDAAAPHAITLAGLPPNLEIGDGIYHLKASATDGVTGGVVSSGVASLTMKVDGVQAGSPSGSCAVGPCTASAEWAVSGSEFGVGQHEVTITAADKAANLAVETFTMYVARPTSPLPVGPGTVEPESGELNLAATDVSMAAPAGSLTVSRTYGSMHLTAGAEGPLGPQWAMNLGGGQNLTKLPNGDMLLTAGSGLQAVYTSEGSGKFAAPKGDQGLVLSEKIVEGKVQFFLKDGSGATTVFALVSGGNGNVWMASTREDPSSHGNLVIAYQSFGGVTEPSEVLAPVPAGVTCGAELKRGCRALTFNYASSTTATGETPSGWGDYKGRLTRVYFTAWDPESSKMTTTTVAQYSYDTQGLLRAEWDPQISPALKVTYGYDASGHVISVTPPGQQPWLFRNGTIQGDARPGRLLSVARPAAATAFGSGSAPASTTLPAISGTASVGSTLTASSGGWSNSPLSYGYQWQNCNSSGTECSPIAGAVNSTYVLAPSNASHKVLVQVAAINAAGATVTSSSATALVAKPAWYFYQFGSAGSGNGQFNSPGGTAVDAQGNIWVADSGNNRIEKFQAPGKFLASYGSTGSGSLQFKNPTGLAINPTTGKVYVADTGNNRIEVLDKEGKYVAAFGSEGTTSGKFKGPAGVAISTREGEVYVVDNGNNRVEAFKLSNNEYLSSYLLGFKNAHGISANPYEAKQTIADTGNNQIQLGGESCRFGCTPFGELGSGEAEFSSPWSVAEEALSNTAFVVDSANNRISRWTLSGIPAGSFGSVGSGYFGQFKSPTWIAESGGGTTYEKGLYISDTGNNRIVLASPKTLVPDPPMTAPTPPSYGTTAVTTIEYRVPVSGAGAPYAMAPSNIAAWGQTAAPVEATAVFPPDEPEGWPAQDYKRASIVYLDARGREINAAAPGGAISTTEYNSSNEVVRTLSPGNRELALKEGAKSAEASHVLDTQTTYNEGAEAGLELTGTLGPLHKVKLSSGSEVEARVRTHYFYDEGAPAEGGPYRLPTKVTTGAQVLGKPEEDVQTTVTSYAGQEGLGWKLHSPTSVTSDPGGINLVRRTLYDPNTGNPTEQRTPGSAGGSASPVSLSQFGSLGSSVGQFDHPEAAAIDSKGNVWVADANNNRVERFSAAGGTPVAYGSLGSENGKFKHPGGIAINQATGKVYVTDTNNNRVQVLDVEGKYLSKWGTSGTGNGQFNTPTGVAIDASGNVYVSDTANNRVQEFSAEGVYVRTIGAVGTGNGQFQSPSGLAFAYGNLYAVDWGNNRVQEFNASAEFVRAFGGTGTGQGQFKEPRGIASDPISGNLYITDGGTSNRIEAFSPTGQFLNEFGTYGTGEGHLWGPTAAAVDTSGNIYVVDEYNARIDVWAKQSSSDTQVIYYTAGANAAVSACGEHPEWEGLLCETRPTRQPETGGVPNLPVTIVTYNIWGQPVTDIETVGTTTRTSTKTYDSAGRLLTASVTSSVGTALPAVKDEYNAETGALVKESTSVEGVTKALTSVFNSLGQMTSYVDADESTSTVNYDLDGRPEKTSDGKGTQTFTYDTTTGLVTKLVDSAAGTFTGAYDAEGRLLTEGYPNGMNVKHAFNANGEATALEYVKTTHCTEKCTWFSDAVTPSISGQWLTQASTLSSQAYSYDNAGRLTKVQDTPAGKGCTTRIYAYDAETNRTSQTTRTPTESGACASEGGAAENHTYDPANRLLDAGVGYDTFGNITNLSAADAGGAELTSTYYVDNTLASQLQSGQTISYRLDPAGRPRETVSTGVKTGTVVSHYAGGAETPAWTVDGAGHWTRNIGGIGGFAATQYNGEAPVLEIENLHGDVVGSAPLSETAAGLSTTSDTSEYGVPRTSTPPKYAWLGGAQKSTEFSSGVVAMGARSYVPQLGRFLQTDPVAGGSANAYSYGYGDPVNSSDPSGEFVPGWLRGAGYTIAHEAVEEEAVREAAAAAAAIAAAEAAALAAAAGASNPSLVYFTGLHRGNGAHVAGIGIGGSGCHVEWSGPINALGPNYFSHRAAITCAGTALPPAMMVTACQQEKRGKGVWLIVSCAEDHSILHKGNTEVVEAVDLEYCENGSRVRSLVSFRIKPPPNSIHFGGPSFFEDHTGSVKCR